MDVIESKGEATNYDLGKKGKGEATNYDLGKKGKGDGEATDYYCTGDSVQGTVPRESSRHASNDGEAHQ